MAEPKLGRSRDGQPMHYSIGALIRKGDKYLLIDRVKPPLGFAAVAGHIDEGESPVSALLREVKEESGLEIVGHKLILEEEVGDNVCSRGIRVHYWYLFECEVRGEIRQNYAETKSIGWYSPEDMKGLELEPVWDYWFRKLKLL